MSKTVHLVVVTGPEALREIHVPSEGIRIGRSSRNDISIVDTAMSRFQCRFFFKPGEGLWLSDLGSANGTLINNVVVQEQQLKVNDEVLAGDTLFRVKCATETESSVSSELPEASVDLGLKKGAGLAESSGSPGMRRKLLGLVALLVVLIVMIFTPWNKLAGVMSLGKKPPVEAPREVFPGLELALERVEGSASNIFRYALEIKGESLMVQVDDLDSNRHVRREKKVASELLRDLARSLETGGFFELREEYAGLAPGIHEASDLSVTIGVKTRRVKVVNHLEPEVFASVRAIIEEFGKNELGLAALAIDPATLLVKAREALLQGKKMWDEREVRDGNLFKAIRSYTECEWYLETIEPKPAFYGEAVSAKADCQREMQRRYEDLLFLAERSVKLRDWKEADRQLKIMRDMIPDPSDERYRNVDKKMVDVGRHLSVEK
ncbi:MAG: FHA domain-containing protein [bacterium]